MDKACLLHSLNIKGLVARETEKEWSGRVWDTCATWSCCGEKKDILLRWHYLSLILRTFIPCVPKCHLWLKTLNCKRFLMSHSFLFLCTLISYLTNVKTNKFVYFFLFFNQLDWWFSCWRAALLKAQRHHQILRKVFNTGGTTTQWDRRSTTGGQSRPPETCLDWTAAPSKVSHTRDANAGLSWQIQTPSQRLKYLWKPGATNTKLRQNPKTVSSKTSWWRLVQWH